jgi:hypothetical protein
MRQPEVCKHQVCDHCGGRFAMVTHRWWGNKFRKRACKNAHRRENHHTQSSWVIPRFFTFAGGACLTAAVAVATLTLLLASANAAPGEERLVAGSSLKFNKEDGTLYIDLSGPIVAGMADDLRAALGKYGTTLNRVVLLLASAGGQVEEGDRVIEAPNEIKLRHQLITEWPTASCVPPCAYRSSSKARTVSPATAAMTPASTAASYIVPNIYWKDRSLGGMFSSSRFAKAPSTTRGFPMRLIALILSSGIALVSIPASASPASNTFGATSVSASTCPVYEGPAGCGG